MHRALRGIAAAAALTLALVVAPPAQAATVPSTVKATISAGKLDFISRVDRANVSGGAFNSAHTKVDYTKLVTAFSGKPVAWRRAFAAGFYAHGGQIVKISDREMKAVLAYAPQAAPGAGVRPSYDYNCLGKSKSDSTWWKDKPRGITYGRTYFNSCQTDELLDRLDLFTVACGGFAFGGVWGAVVGIACAGFIVLDQNGIKAVQRASSIRAIRVDIKIEHNVTNGPRSTSTRYPQ